MHRRSCISFSTIVFSLTDIYLAFLFFCFFLTTVYINRVLADCTGGRRPGLNENKKIKSVNFSSLSKGENELFELLPVELRPAGGISRADYEKLLIHWVEKGTAKRFRTKINPTGRDWRGAFCSRLKTQKIHWKKMIVHQAGATRGEIKDFMIECEGDPLFFLNRSGISAWHVLYQLEKLERKMSTPNEVKTLLLQNSLKADYSLFKRAAQRITPYENIFREELEEAYPLSSGSAAGRLRAVAKILRNPERSNFLSAPSP